MKDIKSLCAAFIGSAPVEKVAILYGKNVYAHDGNAMLELKNVLAAEFTDPVCVKLEDLDRLENEKHNCAKPPRVSYESSFKLENFLGVLQTVKSKVFPELNATFNILRGAVYVDTGERMFGVRYSCLDGFDWRPVSVQYVSIAHTRKVMDKLGVRDVNMLVGYLGLCFDHEKFAVHTPIKVLKLDKWKFMTETHLKLPIELKDLDRADLKCDGRFVYFNGFRCGTCDFKFIARFDPEDVSKLDNHATLRLYADSAWLVSNNTLVGTRRIVHE